jgi:hypothetical protein
VRRGWGTRIFACALFALFFAPSAFSAEAGVAAFVQVERAQIYEKPDFDSKVIGALRGGTNVRVSKGVAGQYYKFHKVRVGHRFGFISDVDVKIGSRHLAGAKGRKPSSASRRARKTKPVYFSRFIGVLVGQMEFKEEIAGVDAKENLLIYGLKITGPDVLINGPIMDFNLALHYGAPSYYDKLSTIRPSGFVLLTDALFLLPIFPRQNFTFLFGVGPMLSYASFQVANSGRAQSLSTLNVGLSTMLGSVVRFGGVGLRLEGKYMIEKQSYTVMQAGLQTEW